MGPLPLFLIFFLVFSGCKREEKETAATGKSTPLYGIYEVFPSYEDMYIRFDETRCQFLVKDTFKECHYEIQGQYLHIYIENKRTGTFLITGSRKDLLRGLWMDEVRFLRKLSQ